jgi:hypothetical protein
MDGDGHRISLEEWLDRSPVWRRLYERDARYRKLWDSGKAPGQQIPRPKVYGPAYNHWGPLHYYAVKNQRDWSPQKAKRFFIDWQKRIPKRGTCNCQKNWLELKLVPDYSSAVAFFEWAWFAHDTVTQHLIANSNKGQRITLDECYAIWWSNSVV